MGCKHKACQNKIEVKESGKSAAFPILTGVLIALFPKCPFCVMAYSSAITLFGGKMLFPNASMYSGHIIVGLSLIVLLGIMLNFKGKQTMVAGGITILGISLLALNQFFDAPKPIYYTAMVLLFFGIWYNGSFNYFYKKYFENKFNYKST